MIRLNKTTLYPIFLVKEMVRLEHQSYWDLANNFSWDEEKLLGKVVLWDDDWSTWSVDDIEWFEVSGLSTVGLLTNNRHFSFSHDCYKKVVTKYFSKTRNHDKFINEESDHLILWSHMEAYLFVWMTPKGYQMNETAIWCILK